MGNDFRKKEEEELINRFEEGIRKKIHSYYDMDTYEVIIDYYLDNSKYRKALYAVNVAMEQFPYTTDLLTVKAQILIHLELYDDALPLLHQAHSLQPTNADVYLSLGSLYSLQNKFQEAISIFTEALEYAEDEVDEIYYHIGLSYQGLGDYPHAIKFYKQCIEINQSHDEALYELAFCLELVGKLNSSLSYYKKFINNDPFSPIAWLNFGSVYNKLELYEEAVEAYQFAIAIDDLFASAHFNLGNTYIHWDKPDLAIPEFEKTLQIEGPSPEVYCCLGAAYENLEQYPVALKYYQKSAKLDPHCDEAWYGAGACMEKEEKWYQALNFFNKALKIDCHNAEYWKAVGHAEFKIGNIVSSINAFEEASLLDAEDKEIWLGWSLIYFEQGEYKMAIDTLREGMNQQPEEDAEMMYRMTVYLIEAGKFQESYVYLQNALYIDFEGHQILYSYFPKVETQKTLFKLIEQYKTKNGQ